MKVTGSDIAFALIVTVALSSIYLAFVYINHYNVCLLEFDHTKDSLVRLELISDVNKLQVPNYSITGVAQGDHFCVYTKDRTITEVLNTCTHEYAHTNLHLKD